MGNPFTPRFEDLPAELPLFPLPGALVMPGIQLPLNIFEPRYLSMVFDSLGSHRMIGMIQPRPDNAESDSPLLTTVGTAGRITGFNETHDGRMLIVLTGVCRFALGEELPLRNGYRRTRPDWSPFAVDYQAGDVPPQAQRNLLAALKRYLAAQGLEEEWESVERLPGAELVNFLISHLPFSPEEKQGLVESRGIDARSRLVTALLEMMLTAPEHPDSSSRH
jgi:Lon protease-like protein